MPDSSSAFSKRKSRAPVRVAPTTYADLQGAAICKLLAYSGAFPPDDPLARALSPFHTPLVRAGAHPRHWPDFNSTVRELEYHLLSGEFLFTAFVRVAEGDNIRSGAKLAAIAGGNGSREKEVIVGMVRMTPPLEVLQKRMKERKWKDRVLRDFVYPIVDNVKNRLWDESNGTDRECADLFSSEMAMGRSRVDPERRCYYLKMLSVHPFYHGQGIGSALLSTCTSIADAEGVPVYLESSPAGRPLYTARGFVPVDTIDFTYSGQRFTLPIMVRQPIPPPHEAENLPSAMSNEEAVQRNSKELDDLETVPTKVSGSLSNLDGET